MKSQDYPSLIQLIKWTVYQQWKGILKDFKIAEQWINERSINWELDAHTFCFLCHASNVEINSEQLY